MPNITNPFMPNYENVSQKVETSVEPDRVVVCPPQVVPHKSESDTSTSTLVTAGDKTVDVTDFDPIKSPTDFETQPISNSSSYVFVESTHNKSEPQPVDISDFDPISSPAPETQTPTIKSPQTTPIPAIPPPPAQAHKRTPRTSESHTSESETYNLLASQSRISTVFKPKSYCK